MYVSGLGLKAASSTAGIQSTGTYQGSSCPPGQVRIRSYTKAVNTQRGIDKVPYVECGYAPEPAAAPAPAPVINVSTAATTQQQLTSAVSPNIQSQVASPGSSQGAATGQEGGGGQTGTGMSTSELLALLAEERAAAKEEAAAAAAASQAAAEKQAQSEIASFLKSQAEKQPATIQTGSGGGETVYETITTPAPAEPASSSSEISTEVAAPVISWWPIIGISVAAGVTLLMLSQQTKLRKKRG